MGSGGQTDGDADVDHLLGTPVAGVLIVVGLVLGCTALIGLATSSILAVVVVGVGSVVVAVILGGLDLVGASSKAVRDRLHHGDRRLSGHDQHVGRTIAHEVAWIPADRPGSGEIPDP